MGIQTIKVLRTISKIVLLVMVLGLVGWGGYYVYRSIAFKPQNIVVTNITDSSATITWTTSSQMNGVVYYKKGSSVLPGPLGIIGSRIGYDDRDVSDAQTACVNEFNKNASETKDENFSVSGENFNCDDARVTGMGKYYTHSVTIKDLDPESIYYFAMGDGIWSFESDVASLKTFELLGEVDTPMPVFGRIVGDDGTYSRDSLVYITFRDGSEEQNSILYSSTSNDDGGWYVDATAVRDVNGNVLELELTNDTFTAQGVYSNYGSSEEVMWVLGYFNGAYPDIVVEKNIPISMLVGRAYASCTFENIYDVAHGNGSLSEDCDLSTLSQSEIKQIGYGNVVKAQVASGATLSNALSNAGLGGGNIATNGNINAIYGTNLDGSVAISDFSRVIKTERGNVVTGTQTNTDGETTIVLCGSSCTTSPVDPTVISSNKECDDSSDCGEGYSCEETICTLKSVYTDTGEKKLIGEVRKETYTLHYDSESSRYSIETSVGTVTNIPSSIIRNYIAVEENTRLSLVPVMLYPLIVSSGLDITNIVNKNEALRGAINDELERLRGENTEESNQKIIDICDELGGGDLCPSGTSQASHIINTQKVYAADTTSYAQYLPEYGLYSFQLGDYSFEKETSNGNTIYLFYIEANGKEGIQIPADPDNPTSEEDIILDSSAFEITYSQESTAQQYEILEGINILSFNFIPVSTELGAYTAEDLINQASDNGVEIQYISAFEGGRWYSGYSCSSDTCTGTNFSIVPGRGYVIYATNDGTITVPGYNLTSSVPVAFSSGWNLVGIHGYTTAYTARTLIDSINKIEGLTSNNVSWWPISKGKYEGLQVENNTEYGLDFAISPTNGYFVRISEYAPSDTTCKSILWNEGGTLNGTCGNTK